MDLSYRTPNKKKTLSQRYLFVILFCITVTILLTIVTAITFHRTNPPLLLSGYIIIPPHLVDFTPQAQSIFFILYESESSPMPLAVMQRPIRYRVSSHMRRYGIRESFHIPLDQIHFMQLEKQKYFERQLIQKNATQITLKVRVDQDGSGGRDTAKDMISQKSTHILGESNIEITVGELIK